MILNFRLNTQYPEFKFTIQIKGSLQLCVGKRFPLGWFGKAPALPKRFFE
jgi:hypothetical protein